MFAELRELLRSGAIRRHQLGPKYILTQYYMSQADIRNPLRYLLITECCFAAYQEWLAPLLIQASPNPLLIASRN